MTVVRRALRLRSGFYSSLSQAPQFFFFCLRGKGICKQNKKPNKNRMKRTKNAILYLLTLTTVFLANGQSPCPNTGNFTRSKDGCLDCATYTAINTGGSCTFLVSSIPSECDCLPGYACIAGGWTVSNVLVVLHTGGTCAGGICSSPPYSSNTITVNGKITILCGV
jgi:ribosomal protein L32